MRTNSSCVTRVSMWYDCRLIWWISFRMWQMLKSGSFSWSTDTHTHILAYPKSTVHYFRARILFVWNFSHSEFILKLENWFKFSSWDRINFSTKFNPIQFIPFNKLLLIWDANLWHFFVWLVKICQTKKKLMIMSARAGESKTER